MCGQMTVSDDDIVDIVVDHTGIVQRRRDVRGGGGPARWVDTIASTVLQSRQAGVMAVLGKLASSLHTCSSQLCS